MSFISSQRIFTRSQQFNSYRTSVSLRCVALSSSFSPHVPQPQRLRSSVSGLQCTKHLPVREFDSKPDSNFILTKLTVDFFFPVHSKKGYHPKKSGIVGRALVATISKLVPQRVGRAWRSFPNVGCCRTLFLNI